MRQAAQDALRAAYAGRDKVEVIAKRHGVSPRTVNRFWESEKLEGRLPNRPRPHFAKHVTVPIAFGIDPVDAAFDWPDVIAAMPTAQHDALLIALISAHGRDPLRGINDEMPLQLLEIERRDDFCRYAPSRKRVVDFQRGRDAYARSKMAEPPAPSNVIYARVGRAWWIVQRLAMLAGPFLAFPAAQEWTRKFGTYHKKATP
jgi:hypothetical protein